MQAYINDLRIAGNSKANIYEAELVLSKVEEAKINLLNQDH